VKHGHVDEKGASYFMYSGQASSLKDSSTGLGTLSVDWKSSDSQFGYFSVFSDRDECANRKTIKSLDFGPHKATRFSSSKVELLDEPRSYIDEKTIKLPSNQVEVNTKKTGIREITGELWLDKFDRSNDEDYIAAKKAGNLAINVLGAVGVINSVFSLWTW